MGYVYKITNDINGKIYIGKTDHLNPETRWKEHLYHYKIKTKETRPLYFAMNKYGVEHFHFEVIEKTDSSIDSSKREQFWINELRTYVGFDDCNGYNATLGGEGVSTALLIELDVDEVKNYHIYEANCLIEDTAEHFNVSKNILKQFLEINNVPYVKDKDLIRLNTYVKYGGVYQINSNTKIIENIFESPVEADKYLGVKRKIASICKYNAEENCIGHYFLGYLWFYGKDYGRYLNQILKFNINDYKENACYDFEEIYQDLLNTKSILRTMYNLNINLGSSSYIRRQLKHLGYDLDILNQNPTYIIQRDKNTRAIINIFHSIREANIYLKKPQDSSNIRACLNGKTKTAYGFIWDYLE